MLVFYMLAFIIKDVDATKEKEKHPTDMEYKQQLISRTISSQLMLTRWASFRQTRSDVLGPARGPANWIPAPLNL